MTPSIPSLMIAVALTAAPPAEPEPAWMAGFRKVYELQDGEIVKRVAWPYIPERLDFYLQRPGGKPLDPAAAERSRAAAAEAGPFMTCLIEQDGTRLSRRYIISSVGPARARGLLPGDNLLTVEAAISAVTGIEPPEYVIDPAAKDDRLFAKDNPTVHGDFVTRKGAPLAKLVPQLEAILRDECKADVRLTLREEEQVVFVVGGTFKPVPPAWRPKGQLDVYATEDGLNKEFVFADHKGNPKTAKHATVASVQYSGTPADFVRFVGHRLGRRMVWDAPLPDGPRLSWIDHRFRNPTPEEAVLDRDPGWVLAAVFGQTGLTFSHERRKVAVLVLGTPEKR